MLATSEILDREEARDEPRPRLLLKAPAKGDSTDSAIQRRSLVEPREPREREGAVAEATDALVTAHVGRLAARAAEAARATRESEYDALLDEHRRLVERKFDRGLDRSEARHLKLTRWRLDRIEAAKYLSEPTLDSHIAEQELLAGQIQSFRADVEALLKSRKRGSGR